MTTIVVRWVLFIGLWILSRVIRSDEALKFRLLAHYLSGNGRDLDLGLLPIDECFSGNPYVSTEVLQEEEAWLNDGYMWLEAQSAGRGTWHRAFGGFYAALDEGRDAWMCRDLYDWHDENPYGFSNTLKYDIKIKHFTEPAAKVLTPLVEKLYAQVGVLDLCNNMEVVEVRGSDNELLSVTLPDGLWLRLGGASFISSFEIDASKGWAHDMAMHSVTSLQSAPDWTYYS